MANEKQIWDFLYVKIGNPYGVAGLMGNLYAESGLIPTNMENAYESKLGYTDATYTAAVDSGTYTKFDSDAVGYGLAQWTYSTRKKALLAYAKQKGVSIGDLNMQLEYLYKELSESYSGVLQVLKSATSVQNASNKVLTDFERPANQSDSVKTARAKYGQNYYDKYTKKEETTMAYTVENLLKIAQNELGYYEKASNSNLDSKTANAGSNNYTKYARDLAAAGYYNGNKNGYAWCFPKGTFILTPNGEIPIEELQIGDEVIDANGAIQTIENINCRFAEDIMSLKVNGTIQTFTTYEHPFLVRKRNGKKFKAPKWTPASAINRLDKVALERGKFGKQHLDSAIAYMVGRYIGDGWCVDRKCGLTYYICCSYEETEELEQRMREAQISFHKDPVHRTCQEYTIHKTNRKPEAKNNELLVSILADCGHLANGKRVPAQAWAWDQETVEAFLEGYYASDGYKGEDRQYKFIANTVSKELYLGISSLMRKFGYNVNVTVKQAKEDYIQGRKVHTKEKYQFYSTCEKSDYYDIDDQYIWVLAKDIDLNCEPDYVYNLTVSNTHTFIANGFVVHNCDVFVDWCFYQLAGKDAKKAQYLICQTGDLGAAVNYSAQYYKNAGRYYTSGPKAGDQIFFNSNGSMTHTGIVESVTSAYVNTIEGNTSNMVARRSYRIGASNISGYGRPRYDGDGNLTAATGASSGVVTGNVPSDGTPSTSSSSSSSSSSAITTGIKAFQSWINSNSTTKISVDGVYGSQTKKAAVKILQKYLNSNYSAKLSVDGSYGSLTAAAVKKAKINIMKGSSEKTLVYLVQGMLYANGYSPNGFDGDFGSGTFAALKKYQSAKGLTADGVAGPNTLNKMFG